MSTAMPRYIPKGTTVVCTNRTIDGRHNFAPDCERFVALCIGVIAYAQEQYDVPVHAVALFSNHLHIMLTSPGTAVVSKFMEFVGGNLSKVANRHRKRSGPVWDGRYDHVALSDEQEVQLAMLGYVLAHGAKEGIVDIPEQWPGATSSTAINPRERKPLVGVWEDRTGICRTTKKHYEENKGAFETAVTINHTPPPALALESPDRLERDTENAIVAAIKSGREKHGGPTGADEGTDGRERSGPVPLRDWTHTSKPPPRERCSKGRRRRFRANTPERAEQMYREYQAIRAAYGEASIAHDAGEPFEYPAETHPRRLQCAPNEVLSAAGRGLLRQADRSRAAAA